MSAPASVNGVVRLDRRRVYIFPSSAGFTLGAMSTVILLGAINYDNALGYMLTFLLGGLFIVAMLHTYANLAGLRFFGARAAPVFVGETALFECLIDNDSALARLNLGIKRWPRGLNRERRRYLRQFETRWNIAAASSAAPVVTVEANRRGLQPLERVMLETRYPLGVLRAWAYFETDAKCLVYPLPRGDLPLPYGGSAATGRAIANPLGVEEFAGMRPYTPGDPVRAIAWKTLAKAQDLMVKRFDGQSAAELSLTWSAVSALEGVERRLSQLTAWVLQAERDGATFRLEIPGTHIAAGRGRQHRDQCLMALALYDVAA